MFLGATARASRIARRARPATITRSLFVGRSGSRSMHIFAYAVSWRARSASGRFFDTEGGRTVCVVFEYCARLAVLRLRGRLRIHQGRMWSLRRPNIISKNLTIAAMALNGNSIMRNGSTTSSNKAPAAWNGKSIMRNGSVISPTRQPNPIHPDARFTVEKYFHPRQCYHTLIYAGRQSCNRNA